MASSICTATWLSDVHVVTALLRILGCMHATSGVWCTQIASVLVRYVCGVLVTSFPHDFHVCDALACNCDIVECLMLIWLLSHEEGVQIPFTYAASNPSPTEVLTVQKPVAT